MFDQFLSKAAELLGKLEPFAVAIVVQYTSPISGKPGYKAIVHSDGRVWGWVGGGCTEPVIVKEALLSLQDGRPGWFASVLRGQRRRLLNRKIL